MSLEQEQDAITASDAERAEIVRCAVGSTGEVGEREAPLRMFAVEVEHRELPRLLPPDPVHDIKGEMECIGVFEREGLERAVLSLSDVDIVLPHPFAAGGELRREGGKLAHAVVRQVGNRLPCRVQNDRIKKAIRPLGRNHAVGRRTVIIDAVARAEDLDMFTDLHFERAADDDVTLLPDVGREFNIVVLRLLGINRADKQRFGDAILKSGGKIVIDHAVRLFDLLPLSAARDRIGRKARSRPLDNIRDVDAERLCATIEKREVQILPTCLAGDVFRLLDVRLFRHFGSG